MLWFTLPLDMRWPNILELLFSPIKSISTSSPWTLSTQVFFTRLVFVSSSDWFYGLCAFALIGQRRKTLVPFFRRLTVALCTCLELWLVRCFSGGYSSTYCGWWNSPGYVHWCGVRPEDHGRHATCAWHGLYQSTGQTGRAGSQTGLCLRYSL